MVDQIVKTLWYFDQYWVLVGANIAKWFSRKTFTEVTCPWNTRSCLALKGCAGGPLPKNPGSTPESFSSALGHWVSFCCMKEFRERRGSSVASSPNQIKFQIRVRARIVCVELIQLQVGIMSTEELGAGHFIFKAPITTKQHKTKQHKSRKTHTVHQQHTTIFTEIGQDESGLHRVRRASA